MDDRRGYSPGLLAEEAPGADPHPLDGLRHPHCLSLDLEVSKGDGQIRAFAGLRPDTGRTLIFPSAGDSLPNALAKLDYLSDGGKFLLGHNLIDFDLPHLRAVNPDLRLLRLPAVDTLRLNPLAFPRNPYHTWSNTTRTDNSGVGGSTIPSSTPGSHWRSSTTSRMPF